MKNLLVLVFSALFFSACSSKAAYTILAKEQCERDAKALGKDPFIECRIEEPEPSYEEYKRTREAAIEKSDG